MAKLGCAKCGGQKMKTGGQTIVGMPGYNATTRPMQMKAGGTTTKKAMPKGKVGMAVNDKIKTKTRNTISGGTRTRTVNNDTEMVNILKKDKEGNVIKNVTRPKFIRSIPESTDDWGDEGPGSAMRRGGSIKSSYKKGGATKNSKLAAMAAPKNKITRADIITAVKRKAKKK